MKTFEGRQLAVVINLDKCLGCHTCSVACKNLWTSGTGQEHMYWNNVESRPGPGYPRQWEDMGGGFDLQGQVSLGTLPTQEDYGIPSTYDYQSSLFEGQGNVQPDPIPSWGPNWEEEIGEGNFPNSFSFFLPRMCNHCTRPVCLEACPRQAIYKREEDGIVLLDQERCRGYRFCIQACPYKKVMFNPITHQSEKCIFCYPRIEAGVAPACAAQCPGRVRFVGYLDDPNSSVYRLSQEFKMALPLHPEYETGPNVFYVPPFSGPLQVNSQGEPLAMERIPFAYLRYLFGSDVDKVVLHLREEREQVKAGQESEILELLNANDRFQL